ncbi:MAG: DUF5615 family PIN-like protein, partial [Cyanobium sp.]
DGMTLWLDAQLPPALARWISEQSWGVNAVAVGELGLRCASDPEIFRRARAAAVVVMTKDRDFIRLLDEQGPPPGGLAAAGQQQQCRAPAGVEHDPAAGTRAVAQR